MKKTILFNILIFCSIIITAQTQHITDSLYKKLHEEVNIVNPSSGRSDVVWERIPLPEGKILQTFKVMPDNNVYIGCRNGGVYKYSHNDWELVGLPEIGVYDFEEYIDGELLAGSLDLYLWDYISWDTISEIHLPFTTNIYNNFFGCGSFADLYRSTDSCRNWDLVFDLSFAEAINGIVATTPDSVFLGITDFVGNEGGVYLSVDSGSTWNHFGLIHHYIGAMAIDNNNQVYAGTIGHHFTSQGGLYKYNYTQEIWDSIFYYPWIESICFNTENHIFTGYSLSNMTDEGGIMHSEDGGETWIIDTTGMGSTWVNEIQIDDNGFLYTLTGKSSFALYKTDLPVAIDKYNSTKEKIIDIYPNPINDRITINMSSLPKNSRKLFIKVVDMNGRSFFLNNSMRQNDEITINAEKINKGIYILFLQTEHQIFTFKLIKK